MIGITGRVEEMLGARTPDQVLRDQERIIDTERSSLAFEQRRYERMVLVLMGQLVIPGMEAEQ